MYHVSNLKYLGFELTLKNPDNIMLMNDGSIIEVEDFQCTSLKVDAPELYVLGQELRIIGPAHNYVVFSTAFNIFSMVFCLVELSEIKNEPAWDEPLVVVPFPFILPKTTEAGATTIRYPSMPHSLNDKDMIKDFVTKEAVPPESWGEKECIIKNVAVTYEDTAKMLAAAITAREEKPQKKGELIKIKSITPAPSEAHQLPIVPKVSVDVSNTHVTSTQLCPESIDKMDDNMREIEPGKYVPSTQLKDDLLTMPEELASFGQKAVISSDYPSAEDIRSATENGSELVAENGRDLDQLSTLEHNTSVDQMSMNLSHESESLMIVTKNELLDLNNDMKSLINSSVTQIVGKVVDQKMTPQFRIVHLDLEEIRAIAESHSENVGTLTFNAFSNYTLPLVHNQNGKRALDEKALGCHVGDVINWTKTKMRNSNSVPASTGSSANGGAVSSTSEIAE
ncbi:hypothetical protein QAD02_008694 [Eretmocerus hayati]|uniref:Uncharacterized protein n=1 Tax=Eretmocerus hayati TaxID=131215 RepID=A0ACC2N9L3_9HYME|nr:hypothetical protein QAD02_008694 [Eretmocerus hayati]